jgi:hypothetical protein
MSRSTGPLRPLIAAALLALLVASVAVSAPSLRAVDSAPLLAAATGAKPKPAAKKKPGALADTVLARVGESRQITISEFRRAWGQVKPPARPDSLTPQTAREFLDLMIAKEALGEEALRETWVWTSEESARVAGLRDRMVMALVLDSALRVTQAVHVAEGKDSLSAADLGTLARDEAIRRIDIQYRDDVLQRLAKAWADIPKPPRDSGVFAALRAMGRDPEISELDMHRVVAVADGHEFGVTELVAYWKRLNPMARPRIESPMQLRELIWNVMYENLLRRRAHEQGYDSHPDIVAHLAKERELIAVTHLVDQEVYRKIPLDSLSLTRYYLENERAWDLPPRVRLLRLVLPDRAQAEAMAEKLRDTAQVETLTVQAQRAGVSYHAEYSAETDSTLYTRGMTLGDGGVMGPDSTESGWAVSRVVAIYPGQARPFSEVRPLVRHAVYGEEGERLMRELLTRVRNGSRVLINESGLVFGREALTGSGDSR